MQMMQTPTRHSKLFWSADVPLDHVIYLLQGSEAHSHFDLNTVCRCLIPPVNLKQSIGLFENGFLVAWCSWAFVSREKSDIFLTGEYKIKPEDWRSGDVLIFMDFVAPFGHTRKLYRKCRELFPKYPKAEWRRHLKGRKVSFDLKVNDD